MPTKPTPVLTDPEINPDDPQIEEAFGPAYDAWRALSAAVNAPPFGLALSWSHYRDGGWLCKALRGTKNLAWLGVWDGYATVTFYFAERHRNDLIALPIPDPLREQAARTEMIGRMLPLMVEIRALDDVAPALEILRYKTTAR